MGYSAERRPFISRRDCSFKQLNHNLLYLVERDLVVGAVIELGGLRGFVVGDLLGLLDGAAVLEVGGDAGGPEGVVADRFG